ncbi:MAG: hypothetical protein M3R26_06155 [Actinomycetota bacterium]|nr:hypothetical protein [Actinomycetota bacterium]MDQ2981885.1 hypothetical protein [Actinomycetota bacterium]
MLSTLLLLGGCGGSSASTPSDVEKVFRVRSPDSSQVTCERHGRFEGKALYRCRADIPTSVHEMRPESSCYTFEHGRLENVTRHVSC